VSAGAGVPNLLREAAAAAEAREQVRMQARLDRIETVERAILKGLDLAGEEERTARADLERGLERLRELARGIYLLGECTARSLDAVASMGEVFSHRLFASALRSLGVPSEAVDPRVLVPTDANFGAAQVDARILEERCAQRLEPLVQKGAVPVTGGYVGATPRGVATTLGRGGSDLSATLVGAALNAEEIQIWTDVDGMMTADPRVVPNARILPQVSFQEASELAYFGAKVLHPATVRPAVEKGIPVRIKNTFQPGGEGTTIVPSEALELPPQAHVRAVAWKSGITTVSVTSSRMLGAHGFLARVFEVFDRHETPVDLVTTSEVSVSVTVDRPGRLDAIREDLAEFCRSVLVEEEMCLVCLVGHHLLREPRLTGRVLSTLEGIPLRMVCLGSTDINLSLVLEAQHAEEAIRRLHEKFLEAAP
jgi:aspartate kinase